MLDCAMCIIQCNAFNSDLTASMVQVPLTRLSSLFNVRESDGKLSNTAIPAAKKCSKATGRRLCNVLGILTTLPGFIPCYSGWTSSSLSVWRSSKQYYRARQLSCISFAVNKYRCSPFLVPVRFVVYWSFRRVTELKRFARSKNNVWNCKSYAPSLPSSAFKFLAFAATISWPEDLAS